MDFATLGRALLLALCLHFLCYSAAALITMTEPGIDDGDQQHRFNQAVNHAYIAAVFAALFYTTSFI